jgi:hypothetical protein
MAVRMPEGFKPYIRDSETLVIDRGDQPSIGSGRPRSLRCVSCAKIAFTPSRREADRG